MAHITSFDKLLEAMSKIADSSDSKLKYDKTVIMEIIQLVDATTGEYAVKYQGNTLQAFAADLKAKYSKGDSVYVKVPEGDFTNTKIIEGKVNNKDTTEQERNIISNTIIDVEPSWFAKSTYGVLPKVDGLIAGELIGEKENPQEIKFWEHDAENVHHTDTDTLLKVYNKEFDKFIIKASFMTNFLGNHIQGNYGLKLTLRLVNMSKEKENDPEYITKDFILDTTSFTGNIYELSSYSPQYAVFQIPKNSFLGVESFTFFQEGMEVDVWTKPNPSNPTENEKQQISTPNIYVKDISVNYVQILDYTQDTYYVLIDTPKGNNVNTKVSKITVSPRLIYKGENVISDSSCEVYWYKENPDALVGTPLYSAQVGCGWELINDEAKVSKNVLTISKNDVIIEQRYKVLILYGKKQSPFTGIITIYNSGNEYSDIELLRDTVKDKDYLYIKNQEYKGSWYRELPNGSYINLDNNYSAKKEENDIIDITVNMGSNADKKIKAYNKVNITEFLSYPNFTIYCKIYDKDKKFLVTRHYEINNVGEETDVTVSFEGEKIYRYDANGDIAIEESEKEKTIDGKIAWREGAGTAFKVKWIDGYDTVIGTTAIDLDNSMMEKVYVDGYNVLHYTIKPKYYNYCRNNTLTMQIITIDGKTYNFPCDILFVKDGEQGTNGTTYITMIRPVKLTTDKKYKLDTDYKVMMQGQSQAFKAYVYKDGKQIENNSNYELLFDWSAEGFDLPEMPKDNGNKPLGYGQIVNITTPTNAPKSKEITKLIPELDPMGRPTGEMIEATEKTNEYTPRGYILKVAVTIRDKSTEGQRATKVYYNFPLAVVFGAKDFDSVSFNTNIPNFVQYESDGSIASYKYEELYVTYNGSEQILNGEILSYAEDTINITQVGGKYYLQPVNSYYYQTGSAGIQIKLPNNEDGSNNGYIVYSIMMYRNTFGNNYINGWDGTQLKLDEKGNYLLAAMVGAGRKNSDNTFTGVVMGTIKDSGEEKDGLFGYSGGQQTFSLDAETGNATFGVNKEIIITPKESTIKGNSTNGFMQLKLIPTGDTDNAIEVQYDEEIKFSVDYKGKMTSVEADITGKITSNEGTIGGWTITSEGITNEKVQGATKTWLKKTGIQADKIEFGSVGTFGTIEEKYYPTATLGNITLKSGDSAIGLQADTTWPIALRGYDGYLKIDEKSKITENNSGYVDLGPSVILGSSGGRLVCKIPASQQSGIYAKFA